MKYFEAHDITEYKDADGNIPEILLIDGNRAAGKTTAFSRKFVSDFLEYGYKFMLVYRYANELNNIAESFFKDIKNLFFPDNEMTERTRANGAYIELFIDGKNCGYAAALNTAAKLKHYSHIFSDVHQMLFDEYQLENGYYLHNEIQKFVSLHMTVARGRGEVVRFVPVYMLSNSVSIFNPYYDAFGIGGRINSRTKVLRGSGFVLLRLVLQEVAQQQEKSAFNRAFKNTEYMQSATDNTFLNDESYNILKRETAGAVPLFNYTEGTKTFTLFQISDQMHAKKSGGIPGIKTYGSRQQDRDGNILSIRGASIFNRIRFYYQNGNITFNDTESKRVFMNLIFNYE